MRTQVCTYCGVVADSVDHVVPRHLLERSEELGLNLHGVMHMRTWEVPACRECNSIIGGNLFPTLAERRRFAHRGLRKKYAKYLSIPDWPDDELAACGEVMRDFIRAGLVIRNWMRERLRWRGGSDVDVAPVFDLAKEIARRAST